MAIVIKKRLSLEFLGEDYKDSYLVFKAISVTDYEKMTPEIKTIGDDNIKASRYIVDALQSRFLEGKFDGQDVTKEDLTDLDVGTILRCFELLTTRPVDPKVETQ